MRGRWPQALCWAISLLLLSLSLQRFYPWPFPHSWEVGVGAAEWGHWLAAVALLGALACRSQKGPLSLCLVTFAIAVAPAVRAWNTDREFSWLRLALGFPGKAESKRTLEIPSGQPLDLYLPKGPGPFPLVLVVHGGSWARGRRGDFAALNPYLCGRGYAVASLDYRLAPQHPYPAAHEDLDRAYDYLLSQHRELRLDPARVAWLGRSAGAQLALVQAYKRRPSKVAVAYYPPTDMLWSYQHPSNPRVLDSCQAIRDYLGPPPKLYAQASPLQLAHPKCPATLLMHGQRDDLVYPIQSNRLHQRLQQIGVASDLLEIPWANHGCDVNLSGPSGQLMTLRLSRFFDRYL